jgi:hypothetical protein
MTQRIVCNIGCNIGMLAALALTACGDDDGGNTCGVTDQTVSGATLTAGTATFGYGDFIWGQNNDCGTTSVTIRGGQTGPAASGFGLGLCVPNPAAIGSGAVSFADRSVIQLVGASASGGGCTYTPAIDAAPIGTVTFAGFCTTSGTVFKVTFEALVPGRKQCTGQAAEGAELVLAGTALIRPQ